ncbi:MAG: alpha/beta hydrolase-fold protein [Planctomycetota bacterium]|nr:alpha/beta hydrolase-fold protein [Planctomycetota bacterium]
MNSILQQIEHAVRQGPRAVERLIAVTDFPHVNGRTVTFLYNGEGQEVALQHGIHGLPGHLEFRRLQGSSVWILQIDVPPSSRMEYKIAVANMSHMALIRDPLNHNAARDPFGANSVVYGDGYLPPDWSIMDADARRGTLETRTMSSSVFEAERELRVYLPARFRKSRRYPLLIVHDGFDYLQFANLQAVLDNLIHRLELPPMVVAMVQSLDRMHEYAADDRHAEFLVHELLPQLEDWYPLVKHAAARGLCGASFGAVASLHCAWRHPGVFGRLLLQSGSFVFTEIGEHERGPMFDPVVKFLNAFRRAPGRFCEQAFVSCGVYESLIYYHRAMVPLLQESGVQVRAREANDGHNWENWRDRLREGLSYLFPGPIWMVYE